MSNRFVLALMLGALLSVPGVAQEKGGDREKKVKLRDLPAAVQAAVKEQSKGATLVGLAQEEENGRTLYEAEMKVNGHGRDVLMDATGKVVSVEEEVALASIPAAAREALLKAVGKGKMLKVESVTADGVTVYEALIRAAGKTAEVKVDAKGGAAK